MSRQSQYCYFFSDLDHVLIVHIHLAHIVHIQVEDLTTVDHTVGRIVVPVTVAHQVLVDTVVEDHHSTQRARTILH